MMRDQKIRPWMQPAAGFTLMEVLVSLAIVSILIGGLGTMFANSGRLYTSQNVTAALQQEVRSALDVIAAEARMAAYNPTDIREKDIIRVATPTRFHFKTDLDGNNKFAKAFNASGECENRSFRFSLANTGIQMVCGEGTGSTTMEYLLGGTNSDTRVVALDFSYRDKNNNATTVKKEIRSLIISIVAEAPAGQQGMIQRTYTTSVDIRNTGPNA